MGKTSGSQGASTIHSTPLGHHCHGLENNTTVTMISLSLLQVSNRYIVPRANTQDSCALYQFYVDITDKQCAPPIHSKHTSMLAERRQP